MASSPFHAYSTLLKPAAKKPNHTTGELHPRNRHRAPYDFPRLIGSSPELARFLIPHPVCGDTIDFSNPDAVTALNRALLKHHYGLAHWDIPRGYLCPPIPSRADYLHYVADLLAADNHNNIPRGPSATVFDIGVGANCVYPLIGAREYGWHFVGTDIDRAAIDWANQLVAANPAVTGNIECRLQPSPAAIFGDVLHHGERFALSICNPPFHASRAEAAAGTLRKLKNLRAPHSRVHPINPVLNFGGQSTELWCDGGECAFVRRMIVQSARQPELCGWFTTLISKRENLPAIYRELKNVRALDVRTFAMFAGQKQTRVVAWTFLDTDQRQLRRRLAA